MKKFLRKYRKKQRFKYIYRIDDINPCMLWDRFTMLMKIFKKHNVVPLLGIIPDNKDESLKFEKENPLYWETIKEMVDKGEIEICQHGYQHIYTTIQSSVNQKFYGRVSPSEFANLSYKDQEYKIKKGKEVLESHELYTDVWMAPSHTNDRNTFKALKKLGFKYITDGIGVYPFEKYGLTFIPQQIWEPKREFFSGVFTICLHLDDLTDASIKNIINHLESGDEIIKFSEAKEIRKIWYYSFFNLIYKFKRISYYHIVRRYRNIKKTKEKTSLETNKETR